MNPTQAFQSFSYDGDMSTVGTRWKAWLRRLDNFIVAMGITCAERETALLLHYAGEQVHDLYEKLDKTPKPAEGDRNAETKYDTAKRILTEHFFPKQNEEYNRYIFRQIKQGNGESIDQYHTKLCKLAEGCGFAEKEKEIKPQIIASCLSHELRCEALLKSEWTLQQLLDKGRAQEVVQLQASNIEERSPTETEENINALRKRGQRFSAKTNQHFGQNKGTTYQSGRSDREPQKSCTYCGYAFDRKLAECPARGKTCNKCKKPDHFASVCMTGKYSTNSNEKRYEARNVSFDNTVRKIDLEEDSDEDSDVRLFQSSTKNNSCPIVHTIIRGKEVEFLVDSGSGVTLIDETTFKLLRKPQLKETSRKIYGFSATHPLQLAGKFAKNIRIKNSDVSSGEWVYVAKGEEICVLSNSAAKKMNLIWFSKHVKESNIRAISKRETQMEIGKMQGVKIKLHIDPSVNHVALPHRRIPFNLRDKVEKEIERLEKLDIIEKVTGPTPWVSPVVLVPKPKSDEIRICVDMRLPNTAIKRERHIIPTVEDIVAEVNGAKYFSTIDLNQAYHQLELHEELGYITTFSTHVGLRRYKRLFFGVTSAAEIFHNIIRETISDIPGTINVSDDILIHGKTKVEHDERLKRVTKRLEEKKLTINLKKNQICQTKVNFFGLIIGAEGLEMDPSKIEAVLNCDKPSTVSEVRSFLGMTTYCSRFIPNHADLTKPLRDLISKGNSFEWGEKCEDAFNNLKLAIGNPRKLAYFDPSLETEVVVDASPMGLGGILLQVNTRQEKQVIAYASKALSPTESRYSQTEREALAIVWGCEQFRMYLLGTPFTVWTDHKPLVHIFNKPTASLSVRLERWLIRMQPFQATIKYLSGPENGADYLSRHPNTKNICEAVKPTERYVHFIAQNARPIALSAEEMEEETEKDKECQMIKEALKTGKWHKLNENTRKAFEKIADEISITPGGLILKGARIFVPSTLQDRVIELAHEGHQGIVRTKQLLRSKVWFPKMDSAVEKAINKCFACQAATTTKSREPVKMSTLPSASWTILSADFYTTTGGEELLVIIDNYSKFPEIEIVNSTSFKSVIPKLEKILSSFGIPEVIKTDNGPPFNGREFAEFCQQLGIKHQKVTPLWPEANGLVERFMRNLGKTIRTAKIENKDWKREIFTFLRNYRATPHPATGYSPAEIIFGKMARNKLPDFKRNYEKYQEKIKRYADNRRHVKPQEIKIGDSVLLKKDKKILQKEESRYELELFVVIGLKHSMVTAKGTKTKKKSDP